MKHLRIGRVRLPITSAWLLPVVLLTLLLIIVSAAAAAAIETDTVGSFGRGLWWAVSLVTTVGFIGGAPDTAAGAVISVVLMVFGFLLLAMVSASLAALFVREEEAPHEAAQESLNEEILAALRRLEDRLDALEHRPRPGADTVPSPEPRGPGPADA